MWGEACVCVYVCVCTKAIAFKAQRYRQLWPNSGPLQEWYAFLTAKTSHQPLISGYFSFEEPSEYLYNFIFLPVGSNGFSYPQSSLAFILLMTAILTESRQNFNAGLICISPMEKYVEHFSNVYCHLHFVKKWLRVWACVLRMMSFPFFPTACQMSRNIVFSIPIFF